MENEVATLARETTSSIGVQRAKDGTYNWSVILYFNGENANERAAVPLRLRFIDDTLRKLFLKEESNG